MKKAVTVAVTVKSGARFRGNQCGHEMILKLNGLDENKIYTIIELNIAAIGKALMSAGIFYPLLSDCGGFGTLKKLNDFNNQIPPPVKFCVADRIFKADPIKLKKIFWK